MKTKLLAFVLSIVGASFMYVGNASAAVGEPILWAEEIPKGTYIVWNGNQNTLEIRFSNKAITTIAIEGNSEYTHIYGNDIYVYQYVPSKGYFSYFTGPYSVPSSNPEVLTTAQVGNKELLLKYPLKTKDGGIYEGGNGGTEGGVKPTNPTIPNLENVNQIPTEMAKVAKVVLTVGLVLLSILLGVSLIKRVIYFFL